MDGAGPWTLLTRIFLPLMVPAMVTTGLLAFIVAWNEFLFALTFTLTNDQRTVPVAIALITGGSEFEVPWGRIMAASVIVTLPLIALVLIFQRRIVAGLTAGAAASAPLLRVCVCLHVCGLACRHRAVCRDAQGQGGPIDASSRARCLWLR